MNLVVTNSVKSKNEKGGMLLFRKLGVYLSILFIIFSFPEESVFTLEENTMSVTRLSAAISTEEPILHFVTEVDPLLRKEARELTTSEILSREIQELIVRMHQTMKGKGVGLAAPQIGKSIQLIIVEDGPDEHAHLTQEQCAERERTNVPFQVVINPTIIFEENETRDFFEGCMSVPDTVAVVRRAHAVCVKCFNEKAEPIVIHATGWYARILQHEIDHLHGVLFVDRAFPQTIMTEEEYLKNWKGKTIKEIMDVLKSD